MIRVVSLMLTLIFVQALVQANPADKTSIPGFYDDGDIDDAQVTAARSVDPVPGPPSIDSTSVPLIVRRLDVRPPVVSRSSPSATAYRRRAPPAVPVT